MGITQCQMRVGRQMFLPITKSSGVFLHHCHSKHQKIMQNSLQVCRRYPASPKNDQGKHSECLPTLKRGCADIFRNHSYCTRFIIYGVVGSLQMRLQQLSKESSKRLSKTPFSAFAVTVLRIARRPGICLSFILGDEISAFVVPLQKCVLQIGKALQF